MYHISSGADYSIKELFDATVRALDMTPEHEVEVRPRSGDDAYTILLDPTQTERDFGWKIATPLAQGVQTTIAWYKQYGISQTYTHLQPDEAKK